MSTIGFIGLGTMGRPMAANLVKAGYVVRGFDVVAEACNRAAADGVKVTSTAVEAATGADALITMLPKGEHVSSRRMQLQSGSKLFRLPGCRSVLS